MKLKAAIQEVKSGKPMQGVVGQVLGEAARRGKSKPPGTSSWKRAILASIESSKSSTKIIVLEAVLYFVKEAEDSSNPDIWYEKDSRSGKIGIVIRRMSSERERSMLLGLTARYPEFVRALVTHDLNSGQIMNLGGLISEIRLDDRFEY